MYIFQPVCLVWTMFGEKSQILFCAPKTVFFLNWKNNLNKLSDLLQFVTFYLMNGCNKDIDLPCDLICIKTEYK